MRISDWSSDVCSSDLRTLVFAHNALQDRDLQDRPACATLGLGSGIVADSRAADEWRECLAKGEFVGAAGDSFDLIETMPFDPVEGVQRDRKSTRLNSSH